MLGIEVTEDFRPSELGPLGAPLNIHGYCGGFVIVERLLDKLGTSSTDIRTDGPGSPNVMDRASLMDEVAVLRRGVWRETWLLLKCRLEKEEAVRVSGVMIGCCGRGSCRLMSGRGALVSSAVIGGVIVESESRPREEARGSSKSSTTSTCESPCGVNNGDGVGPLFVLAGGDGRKRGDICFGVPDSLSWLFCSLLPNAIFNSSLAGVDAVLLGLLCISACSAASSSSSSKTSGIAVVGVSLAFRISNGTNSGALSVRRWFIDWNPSECIDRLGRGCCFAGEPLELAPNGGVLNGPNAASRSMTGLMGSESA